MKPTIALFLHDPKCSVQSGNGLMRALGDHYKFKIFGKNRLEDVFFDGVDMIVVPGGFGDADSYASLFKNNEKRVKEFIADGGRYLGICMGAYWAGMSQKSLSSCCIYQFYFNFVVHNGYNCYWTSFIIIFFIIDDQC